MHPRVAPVLLAFSVLFTACASAPAPGTAQGFDSTSERTAILDLDRPWEEALSRRVRTPEGKIAADMFNSNLPAQ